MVMSDYQVGGVLSLVEPEGGVLVGMSLGNFAEIKAVSW